MDSQSSKISVPLVRFDYSGGSDYDTTILISPFYPFNHFIIKQLIDKLDLPKSRIVYTEFPPGFHRSKRNFTVTDLIEYYRSEIARYDDNIILIGFGIFAVVFSVLYSEVNITKLILFEPDFSNLLLERLFDSSAGLMFFKSSFLIKLFTPGKIEKQFIHKLRVRHFRTYFFSVRSYLEDNKIFQSLVEKNDNVHIFWNFMEKESFPLAQVLSEEYSIELHRIKKTIYEELTPQNSAVVLKNLERLM